MPKKRQKRILFIGAGPYQKKGIETAKKMGLYVIAADGNPNAPGLPLADKEYDVNVTDVNANLEIARKEKIDGVCAVASDISMRSVATISEILGLPGISRDVAERCLDKELMRKAFVAAGVPSPKSFAVYTVPELLKISKQLSFPVVIKPSDSAGSRGVRRVDSQKGLKDAFENAVGLSSQKKVIIEEFMEGVECSVEAFVVGGEIHIITLSDKVRTKPPILTDIEVSFPSAYPEKIQKEIIDVAKRAIRAVGVKDAPIHMELMMTKSGPVPVELAARGPGFKLFTDIIPEVTGINVLKALIDLSVGKKPVLRRAKHKASVIRFFSTEVAGTVKSIEGVEEIRKMRGVYEIIMYVNPGDRARALTSGQDRLGHIISMAPSLAEAHTVVERALARLSIEITPDAKK